jgi:hypothetical protein
VRAVVVTGPSAADWQERDIEDDLPSLQALVGGYIELVPLGNQVTVFVNEEGRLKRLPLTALWFTVGGAEHLFGPIVILGPIRRSKTTPLTDEALAFAKQHINPAQLS